MPPPTAEFSETQLDGFIRERLGPVQGAMRVERISGGQSNPTFFVSYDDRRMVLRKKPQGVILPSAHAVDREAWILRALECSGVPVPKVLTFHAEPDVVGTPFYLMERVEGRVFGSSALEGVSPDARRAMFFAYAETMARLHDVDWCGIGLGDFGRPEGYFARQIARWSKQWAAARFRDLPALSALQAWLSANLPADDGAAAICHGDLRLGNLMFHPTEPRVVAVLDWELSTIGHPLADVGFAAIAWRSAPDEYGGLLGLDLDALGIPSEAAFLARYAASRRTAAAALLPFHVAFAMFRFAVIFEGIAGRSRAGTAAGADAMALDHLSAAFARRGLASIEGV